MKINCEERYQEAVLHAEKTNDHTLQDCFERLEKYESFHKGEAVVRKESAPLSFYFEIIKDGKRIMNGGIIYHGSPDQSGAITMIHTIGWQIHT